MKHKVKIKILNICLILIALTAIFFIVGMIILRYQVEGETNLPFTLSKITIVSSVDAVNNEDATNRWNMTVSQNNDIYLAIEKNSGYNKTEIIENVIIDNFVIEKQTEKGEKNIYAPTNTETEIFKNAKENISEKITYTGELDSNIKEHKISNQGGLIAFRYANDNIATYISNEQEQIEYNKLLQNTNTQINDLKAKISFDLILNLKSNKSFKATISLDIPAKDNIIEDGTSSTEITDLTDIIFKRDE